MKKIIVSLIIMNISSLIFARDLVITKLNVSPIKIGNRQLKIGDSFSDADIIYWSSSRQDMKAKPKSGGLPRHYSAAAFNKKSQKSISIKQYLNYLNKTNRPGPSTLDAGDLYMQKSEKSEKFPEKRIALVIGNSIYGLLGKDLDCPISDAEDVSNTLNELGFDTYTLYDVTYEDFQRALLKFSNVANAESYEVALFYFCGHGNQNDGMNYLLPSDAKNDSPEDIEGWISFDAVFESLAETECKTKLVFLDACRNTPRWQAENKPSKLDQYDTHGSYVVYSTSSNTVALGEQEEDARNTPFGAAFLESIVKPTENVSLTVKSISEAVRQKTEYYVNYGESPRQVYTFGVGDVDFSFVKGVNIEASLERVSNYLSNKCPEMALVHLYNLKPYFSFMDSIQQKNFNSSIKLCDESMLMTKAYLISIVDSNNVISNTDVNHIISSRIAKIKERDFDYELVINTSIENSNTLYFDKTSRIITNNDKTLFGLYVEENDTINNYKYYIPSEYNETSGIKIISLNDGVTIAKAACWAWYPWLTYPISISNTGDLLVFKEGYREREFIWFVNFKSKKKQAIFDWYENFGKDFWGDFSQDETMFFLLSDENDISIYDSQSLNVIHTFKYDSISTVYWKDNNLCVEAENNIYIWTFAKNAYIKDFKIASCPIDVAINKNNTCLAAINNSGDLYVINLKNNVTTMQNKFLDYPSHIAFANNESSIWAINGYNKINCYNIIDDRIYSIKSEDEGVYHSYWCNIYIIPNTDYCVTSHALDHQKIRIYETNTNSELDITNTFISKLFKRKCVGNEELYDELEEISHQIFDREDEIDYDPLFDNEGRDLVCRKISNSGSIILEGYDDGTIRICASNMPNNFIELMKPIRQV